MTDIYGPKDTPFSTTVRPTAQRTAGNLDTFFKDCTSPSANDGTDIEAEWLNGVAAAMRVLARGNGQRPDGTMVVDENDPDNALLRAVQYLIQRGQPRYAVAGGTENALTVSLDPSPASYGPGMTIVFVPPAVNTGPATLSVNGLDALPILLDNGTPLVGGELYAGQPVSATCNADATAINLIPSRRAIDSGIQNFTDSGNASFTASVTGWHDVEVIGGSAGGGGVGTASNGSAGGGGAGQSAQARLADARHRFPDYGGRCR